MLEKNRRPGVKILMSGGTRCNITNARGLRGLSVVSGGVLCVIGVLLCGVLLPGLVRYRDQGSPVPAKRWNRASES